MYNENDPNKNPKISPFKVNSLVIVFKYPNIMNSISPSIDIDKIVLKNISDETILYIFLVKNFPLNMIIKIFMINDKTTLAKYKMIKKVKVASPNIAFLLSKPTFYIWSIKGFEIVLSNCIFLRNGRAYILKNCKTSYDDIFWIIER